MNKKQYQKYIDVATEEVLNPDFEITKQHLEVHEVEMEDGKPKVARVNDTYFAEAGIVAVYFCIKGESFFLEIHLKKEPEIHVDFIWTQPGHRVYLSAKSENLDYDKMSQFLTLKPLTGWNKGDISPYGDKKRKYDFSSLKYEPIENLAYSLEEKLDLLFDDLEKDKQGVLALGKKVNLCIIVCKYQYVDANAGVGFEIDTINRMHALNLGIDIDTYIVGNPLK